MGWVSRPSFSRWKSLQPSNSVTVWSAKNSGVTRLLVASQVTAFAPFSQNWKVEVCSLSGHAQPGQSKPMGLFTVWQGRRRLDLVHLVANGDRGSLEGAPSARRRVVRSDTGN